MVPCTYEVKEAESSIGDPQKAARVRLGIKER